MASVSTADPESLVRSWAEAYHAEVLEFAHPEEVSNEEVFADVYHSLIHSPLSTTLLQLEHSHAQSVASRCDARDAELAALDRRQVDEMSRAVAASADEAAEADAEQRVNRLAQTHLDERQMALMRWESDVGSVRHTLAREFKEWVMCVHEELKTANDDKAAAASGSAAAANSLPPPPRSASTFSIETHSAPTQLQESFTITLGAQMKQMHNLRLAAGDAIDLCRYPAEAEEALPQRLQTSMSLYSANLCGLVLLTDERVSALSSAERDLAALCQRSPEFHFPAFEQQLDSVRGELEAAREWRAEHRRKKALEEEAYAPQSSATSVSVVESYGAESVGLKAGDFFVTRHSNLCEVHVVFHMVADDSALSVNINSRHPVIMGLRNVLKTASLCSVTNLTLPLLLVSDMSETMTVQWCLRRAELTLKCVKGFMMEMSSWGGSEIKTLQFLVPAGIDTDVFQRLTAMLAQIFRTSNPIRS